MMVLYETAWQFVDLSAVRRVTEQRSMTGHQITSCFVFLKLGRRSRCKGRRAALRSALPCEEARVVLLATAVTRTTVHCSDAVKAVWLPGAWMLLTRSRVQQACSARTVHQARFSKQGLANTVQQAGFIKQGSASTVQQAGFSKHGSAGRKN
jgi:hypothetical protein